MANRDTNQPEKHVQLDQQQISYIVASALMGSFFIFMAGYYWGKKNALEPVTEQFTSDSLADKIYCALCSEEKKVEEEKEDTQVQEKQEEKKSLYYAQLAGFGSLKAAQRCSEKLISLGFETRIVERISKTGRGAERTWYQVISNPYTTKEELLESLKIAQKYVKLQTISFVVLDEKQRESLFGKERHTA